MVERFEAGVFESTDEMKNKIIHILKAKKYQMKCNLGTFYQVMALRASSMDLTVMMI